MSGKVNYRAIKFIAHVRSTVMLTPPAAWKVSSSLLSEYEIYLDAKQGVIFADAAGFVLYHAVPMIEAFPGELGWRCEPVFIYAQPEEILCGGKEREA